MRWHLVAVAILGIALQEGAKYDEARKLFMEAYGARIASARSRQAKVMLIRELLDVARREQDVEVRRIELECAEKLSLEVGNLYLAVEVIREKAHLPCEDSRSPEELKAEAERIWASKVPESRLIPHRLEGLALWFRSRSDNSLEILKWEERIREFVLSPLVVPEPYPPAVKRALRNIAGTPVMIINAQSGFSLNVATESKEINATVMQYPLQPDKVLPSSRWMAIRRDENVFIFRNINSGLFLSVVPGQTGIVQAPLNDTEWFLWRLLPTKSGGYLFQSEGNKLFMSPPVHRLNEGVGVWTHAPDPDGGIIWRIVPAP